MTPSTLNKEFQSELTENRRRKAWKKRGLTFGSAVLLLGIWAAAAAWVFPEIILPSPGTVFLRLFTFMQKAEFWASVSATVFRGLQAFIITLLLGTGTGIAAGMAVSAEALFNPLLTVIKATPVMSFILLAFIWFETGTVPIFTAVLMAFPLITHNVMIGVREVDSELLQMASVYRFSLRKRLRHILLPSIVPYFLSGGRAALGMCWKVVVAAEVLTVPKRGIGSRMQFAQMNLDTAEVLAWTVTAIILAALSSVIFNVLAFSMQPQSRRRRAYGS